MKSTVLIIEDNEQNMYMLSYLLQKNNYNVIEAFNGKDGLKLAHDHHPEIILIDIQLPDMDGYEICNKLSHNGLPKSTVIIAVTSYAMGGDKEKAIELFYASGINFLRTNVPDSAKDSVYNINRINSIHPLKRKLINAIKQYESTQ